MSIPTLDELNLLHEQICHALADPKRIQLMYAIDAQPRHVGALAELLDLPQPTVSRHLSILRQRGLVMTERDGAAVIYRLADHRLIEVLEVMRQVLKDSLERRTNTMA